MNITITTTQEEEDALVLEVAESNKDIKDVNARISEENKKNTESNLDKTRDNKDILPIKELVAEVTKETLLGIHAKRFAEQTVNKWQNKKLEDFNNKYLSASASKRLQAEQSLE